MHSKASFVVGFATSLLITAGLAMAQVEQTPMDAKSLVPPGEGKRLGIMPADAPQPASDPRDLHGIYMNAPVPMMAPSGQGGGSGGGMNAGPGGTALPVQPEFPMCIPEFLVGAGGYAMKIFQSPGRVTFISEDTHVVRSVYLDGKFPQSMTPRHMGYSIGHWEGDSLLIETRGVKTGGPLGLSRGMSSITRIVERVRKLDGGNIVEDVATTEGLDAAGKQVTSTTSAKLLWRPDLRFLEYICEDTEGLFFTK